MLPSVLIMKLFLDALGILFAGVLFSLLLLRGKAHTARMLVSYVPAFISSLILVAIAALTIRGGEAISFTLPSTFAFIPYAFRIDLLGAVFLLIIGVVGAAASLYGASYSRHYDGKYNTAYLGLLFNAFIASMVLVVTANDALFFLVAWEVMSLSSYLLIVFEHQKQENIRAGFFYFVMMHIGAAAIVGALFTLAHFFGSTSFDVWRDGQATVPLMVANFAFVLALIGFGTKAGMMPLHTWLPEAHPAAPAHVSALMSGVMIKTALLLLIRFIFEFLPTPALWWGPVIMLIGAVSAVLGILHASGQTDLKRLLAFSSIENIGLMTMTLGAGVLFLSFHVPALVAVAFVALFFHIVNHAMFKGLLFLTAGTVVAGAGTANMEKLGGLVRFLPRTTVFFFIAALAVSAFPPTNGFASEWMIFQVMLDGLAAPYFLVKALFLTALTALAFASGITILAFAKAFGMTFLARPRMEDTSHIHEATGMMQFAYAILTAMIVVLGLGSKKAVGYFEQIALSVGNTQLPVGGTAGLNIPVINLLPIAIIITGILILVFLIVRIVTKDNKEVEAITWDCGYPLYPNNEISATAFSRTLLMFLKRIIPTRKHVEFTLANQQSPYFLTSKTVVLEIVDQFERFLYQPTGKAVEWCGKQVKRVQNGNLNAYILYILIALILLVAIYI